MTAFIKQEAMEKAREIHLKADEEFAIEKSKLVRQETQSIDSQYEKKFKQAAMSQQITRSTSSNKTRLRVLQARQELLDKLFEDARKKIVTKGQDKDYDGTLEGLILEGLYMLAEPKVGLRCKKNEKDKVKKAAEAATKEYKDKTGNDCSTVISDKDFLPEESYVSRFRKLEITTNIDPALEECSSLAVVAKSSSITLSMSVSRCAKQTLYLVCGQHCSVPTRTGSSPTDPNPIHCFTKISAGVSSLHSSYAHSGPLLMKPHLQFGLGFYLPTIAFILLT